MTFEDFLKIALPDENKIPEDDTEILKIFKEFDRKEKGYLDINDLEKMAKNFHENFSK